MGDPRRIRKKFSPPGHPWQKVRIDEEAALKKEFGIPSNTEIWKMVSRLKDFKDQVKKLSARSDAQAEVEKQQLLKKVQSLGLLQFSQGLEEVLGLSLKNVLDRRLQSILVKKTLARTMKQARQMIVHEHVQIAEKKITSPSYLVPVGEEDKIAFDGNSPFTDSMHPERNVTIKQDKGLEKVKKEEEEVLAYKPEEIVEAETLVVTK